MKSTLSLGFLAFLVAATTAQVEELTDANFKEKLASKPFVMVDFYSPTCPFCQKLEPEYNDAATQLQASQPSVLVAKVNCKINASKIACTKIRFVPWIIMIHEGKQIMKYGDRPRNTASIVKFVNDSVKSKDQPNQQLDISLPTTQPPNTCDQAASQVMSAGALLPTPTEHVVTDLTDSTFSNFIRSSPYVVVDYYTPWCSDCAHLNPLYQEAADHLHKTAPSIKFAKVDCNQGNTATFLTCGASKLKFYPWVVLYHDGKPISNYEQENIPSTDAIYDFIDTDSNLLGRVINLDDSNYESTIAKFPYVAVNFYAPWCFYCKKMAPIYKEVAKEERTAHSDIRLVQVDCSATNPKTRTTCSKNDISFLPQLKFFQKGKFVKEYEGDKTKREGIIQFINDTINQQETELARRTMESKRKEQEKEGSSDDKDGKKSKDSPKKISKDKKSKKHDKKVSKKNKSINAKAARILKKVFKQFRKNSHHTKSKSSKHNDDDDDDDDDENDTNTSDKWQQIAKDIHHIAKDMHRLTKEFHKAMNKRPAVDRLFKAFHKLVKTKEEDEDDY